MGDQSSRLGRSAAPWSGAAWTAIAAAWSIDVTQTVPDRFGVVDPISGDRLSEPIGYRNALGLLAAMGALLGAGLATRA